MAMERPAVDDDSREEWGEETGDEMGDETGNETGDETWDETGDESEDAVHDELRDFFSGFNCYDIIEAMGYESPTKPPSTSDNGGTSLQR